MAVARRFAGTAFSVAAFTGPVPRKMRNTATDSDGTIMLGGPKKQTTAGGIVNAALNAGTRYNAFGVFFDHHCASHPPSAVPPSPATTIIGPITAPAASIEYPASRCRNDGIHHEIPPSENVTAAYPRIELRYALFFASDNAFALSVFASLVTSVLCGSRMKNRINSSTKPPGPAPAIKLILHP